MFPGTLHNHLWKPCYEAFGAVAVNNEPTPRENWSNPGPAPTYGSSSQGSSSGGPARSGPRNDGRGDGRGDSRGDGRGDGRGNRDSRSGRNDGRYDNRNANRSDNGGNDGEHGRGLPLSELDPALTSVSHKVIGCSRDVHMTLGPGYDASVYREALKGELTAQGIHYKQSHQFPVNFKGRQVGTVAADLYIADRFVVTVLAHGGEVSSTERAAQRAVLKAGDLELGLIVNFGGRLLKDGLVRVLNPDKLNAMRAAAGESPIGAAPPGHDFDGAASDEGVVDVEARSR